MTQKSLIVVFFILFALSAWFLFWTNARELDPTDKNFWTLSFAAPERPETLDFTIANFTDDTSFEYTVHLGQEVLEKNTVQIERTRTATIKPLQSTNETIPTTITVTHGTDQKEIYRR